MRRASPKRGERRGAASAGERPRASYGRRPGWAKTVALVALVGIVCVRCAGGGRPGDGSETNFLTCKTTLDCAELGNHYGCRGGECRPREASADSGRDARPSETTLGRFQVQECGSDRFGPLFTGTEPADYQGLRCVAWDASEGRLVVDLINFPEDCGFHGWEPETLWAGEATSVEPESLRLVAEWSFESPNACGKCAHNFSFEVTPAPRADSLPVEIATRGCTEDVCGWTEYSIILPLGSTASGIRCAYGETRNLDAPPSDGSLHLPPVDGGSCAADLETFAHEAGRDICVATCSGDAECPLAGQLSCQQGLCVLADPWE